jgi:L-ascorbate metabolism protein UlaG (beta-lactamase superfamily)
MRLLIFLALHLANLPAFSHDATAHYLANEGVMVENGATKVVFDPLFNNDYGRFELLPKDMKAALLAGEAPYDNLSAAFISHSHEDHFDPEDMVRLMLAHPQLKLFAPIQAVKDLRAATNFDSNLEPRITAIKPTTAPQSFQLENLLIDAHSIPHAGWPENMTDIHNLVFRVSVANATVVHLGDADTKDHHFAPNAEHWDEKTIHMAFPPYWYLYSENGKKVLKERLRPNQVVGIHVPKAMPDNEADRPPEYQGPDLFTVPGETRVIRLNSEGAAPSSPN